MDSGGALPLGVGLSVGSCVPRGTGSSGTSFRSWDWTGLDPETGALADRSSLTLLAESRTSQPGNGASREPAPAHLVLLTPKREAVPFLAALRG